MNSVGKGVGRNTPDVGASVLFVPAFAEKRMFEMEERRRIEDFIFVVELKREGGLVCERCNL